MKIFGFTDIHGNTKVIDKLVEDIKEEKPDILVCCGDLSNFGVGLKGLIERFKASNSTLLIIPGNHESAKQIYEICSKTNFAVALHKASYSLNDYLFFGYGKGGFSKVDKEFSKIGEEFKKTIKKDSKVILVTHAPPHNTSLDKLDHIGNQGNKSIRKFVEEVKPVLHLCGHLHENAGNIDKINKTVILNPGEGKVIEI